MARERLRLFLLALALLLFELVAARQLQFVATSLDATLAIALATTGIGLGAACQAAWPERAWRLGELGFAASVAAAIPLFWWSGGGLPALAPLLLLPFVAGGAALAPGFARLPAGQALAADLAGAATGGLVFWALLPRLHEEGLQLLCVGLAAFPLALRWAAMALIPVFAALAGALAPLTGWPYLADLPGPTTPMKLYGHPGRLEPLAVASSAIGRVDVLRVPGDPTAVVFENANNIDNTTPLPAARHIWDPRVPATLPERPDIFIVGTTFQGILKTARRLGGRVAGTEINGEALALYRALAADWCADCYEGIEAEAGDARRWLLRHPDRFHFLSLLNTFAARGDARRRGPDAEYLHSVEAVDLYLDRLHDDGIVSWEIPEWNGLEGRVLGRLVDTSLRALADRGAAHPSDHLVVYRWAGAYDQLMVKKSPWTAAELERLGAWMDAVSHAPPGTPGPVETVPVWSPAGASAHPIAGQIEARRADPASLPARSEVLTDDRPFPFWTPETADETWRAWRRVAIPGTILLFFPLLLAGRAGPRVLGAGLVAGLSGVGFLAWEVAWIGALGRVVEAAFLVGVLAPLLGGAVGALLPAGRLWVAGLVLTVAGAGLASGPILDRVAGMDDPWRWGAAALACGLPAVFMGGVLPRAVEAARAAAGDRGAVLAYGINGGAAAVGSTLPAFLAPELGLQATLSGVVLLYGLVLLGLRLLRA